jgi:hypothetical protein
MNDDDFAELFRKLPPPKGTSWGDVADEFAALGRTIGDVMRSAWQGQPAEGGVSSLRESLSGMIEDVNRTVDGTPEAQQARDQLVRFAESVRSAAERASEELRPELLTLLRQANSELRRVSHLDDGETEPNEE